MNGGERQIKGTAVVHSCCAQLLCTHRGVDYQARRQDRSAGGLVDLTPTATQSEVIRAILLEHSPCWSISHFDELSLLVLIASSIMLTAVLKVIRLLCRAMPSTCKVGATTRGESGHALLTERILHYNPR